MILRPVNMVLYLDVQFSLNIPKTLLLLKQLKLHLKI